MKNRFEIPELTIILFEDEFATDPTPVSDPTATSEYDEYSDHY